jgi:spore coat protein U-like protein
MKYSAMAFALGFVALNLFSRPALAATSTASISVSATVLAACQVSAPATAFGTYSVAGASATSALSVSCTMPTPYNVSLSAGVTAGSIRTLNGPVPALMSRALLPDSGHTANSGRVVASDAGIGTSSGSSRPESADAPTEWARYLAPGAFADAIAVNITY